MKILIEINDKDRKDKTTYFVMIVDDVYTSPKEIYEKINETWKIKDHTVQTLRDKLDQLEGIEYLYDCTNPTNPIMELEF